MWQKACANEPESDEQVIDTLRLQKTADKENDLTSFKTVRASKLTQPRRVGTPRPFHPHEHVRVEHVGGNENAVCGDANFLCCASRGIAAVRNECIDVSERSLRTAAMPRDAQQRKF